MGELTLLATSRTLLRKGNGELHSVRLLIDQESELSFIMEDLVQGVQLTHSAASIPLLGIGGTYFGRTKGSVSIQLLSIQNSASYCQIRAFVCHVLRQDYHRTAFVTSPSSHLSRLLLADPDYSISGPIQAIIGSDNYHAVIRPGLIPGDLSSPTAQQTFGWDPILAAETPVSAHAHHCSPDLDLQNLISRFWTQEELPDSIRAGLTEEEKECERHLLDFRLPTHEMLQADLWFVYV